MDEIVSTSPPRQHRILQLIPKPPRKVTVEQLAKRLAQEGIRVTTRTVRRDLEDLAEVHPLECDAKGRPQGWSWSREAAPLLPPTLDPHTALAFTLLAKYAAPGDARAPRALPLAGAAHPAERAQRRPEQVAREDPRAGPRPALRAGSHR